MPDNDELVPVRLKRAEFSPRHGGKIPAGGVVRVTPEVAADWSRANMLDDGTLDKNERSWAEQRLADIEAEKAELRDRIKRDTARSGAWDVESRDVGRHQADADQLTKAAEARVERAEASAALYGEGRREGPGPGPVNTAPQDHVDLTADAPRRVGRPSKAEKA